MQKKKIKRVEVTVWKNIIIIMDLDEHGKAADRLVKALPASAEIAFNSPCG